MAKAEQTVLSIKHRSHIFHSELEKSLYMNVSTTSSQAQGYLGNCRYKVQ